MRARWPRGSRELLAVAAVSGLALLPHSADATRPVATASVARHATAPFHDLDQTILSGLGYEKFLDCFDDPRRGGMGQHYVNSGLLDGVVDASHPEALVFEVRKGRQQLVAVEYLVPIADWPSAQPPRLFGHDYGRNDTLGVYALHAWIWRFNPSGTFADYNPRVAKCPGTS